VLNQIGDIRSRTPYYFNRNKERYNPFIIQNEGTSPVSMTSDKEKQDTIDPNLREHKQGLIAALRDARMVRRSIIQKIQASPYVQGNETEFLANSTMFTKVDEAIHHMTKHLEVVDSHYSISEWSKEVQARSNDLCVLVTSIGGIGAAISYTTIFSATRGSIGLMSWAFVLFLMGLTLPMGSQILLSWAAAMPPTTKFPAIMLKSWRFVVTASILSSILWTVAAIFLLLISLYEIQYSPVASGDSAALVFTNAPRTAFWLAIACISLGCLHLIKVHLLVIWENSWESIATIYLISDHHIESKQNIEV